MTEYEWTEKAIRVMEQMNLTTRDRWFVLDMADAGHVDFQFTIVPMRVQIRRILARRESLTGTP